MSRSEFLPSMKMNFSPIVIRSNLKGNVSAFVSRSSVIDGKISTTSNFKKVCEGLLVLYLYYSIIKSLFFIH